MENEEEEENPKENKKEEKPMRCKITRKDVIESNVVNKLYHCPNEDIDIVLEDWKKIKKNFKEISLSVFKYLFAKYPFYQELFPEFEGIAQEDLQNNEYFVIHSCAVLKGMDLIMKNLSGEYEEENEILPAISVTHKERGIAFYVMNHLKKSMFFVFCSFLMSNKREKTAWTTVLDFIFRDYITVAYSDEEEEEESDLM